ncbi:Ina17p KNAG_0A01760 [Huiozyma naganishii CBS 8797]|uniref:Inner membrane assembly complex subunit 17 n=1 Tax=Huiozyma naganishii (strain ATCC MYA-139 / BCRC 22969 / CBS 8797 / KCTC 17520 / NBRC 10181 / NCYC 3082 / Yp74L-3) TaxID=1071383 RepID=J7QZG6_HUIN7|nr:hypothetical protein KNAG_0A01760 [Kazachstania naganishii CBS 8797]CCK67865.1 hypothetical protein KNAG_0A01760 [Kazachstania naganishii CBS 8797]
MTFESDESWTRSTSGDGRTRVAVVLAQCTLAMTPLRRAVALGVARGRVRLLSMARTPRTLDELAHMDTLEGVDPQVVQRLILDRSRELEGLQRGGRGPLRMYVRPAWVVFLMASSCYMAWQWVWWSREYERRELQLAGRVRELESILEETLSRSKHNDKQPWYRRLLTRT